MNSCFRCERDEKEVKLFDAIYGKDVVKVCERCAITEEIPVIKKPSTTQLRESEKAHSVYQRLKRLAGLDKKENMHETMLEQIKKIEENPSLERVQERKPLNLIHNFHWDVMRARRNKGLSQRQLGWALGESEAAVKIIEKGQLPGDTEKLIKKLEQFFQISLIEKTKEELAQERKKEEVKENLRAEVIEGKRKDMIKDMKPLVSDLGLNELELITSIASGKIAGENPYANETDPVAILGLEPEAIKKSTVSEVKNARDLRISEIPKVSNKSSIDSGGQTQKFNDLRRIREQKEMEVKRLQETQRKRELQAESFISGGIGSEMVKRELKEQVASDMKNIATGKKTETIGEKREMPSKAISRTNKEEKSRVPTISELMERKKEREKALADQKLMEAKSEVGG